jgi:hypothetical protein
MHVMVPVPMGPLLRPSSHWQEGDQCCGKQQRQRAHSQEQFRYIKYNVLFLEKGEMCSQTQDFTLDKPIPTCVTPHQDTNQPTHSA